MGALAMLALAGPSAAQPLNAEAAGAQPAGPSLPLEDDAAYGDPPAPRPASGKPAYGVHWAEHVSPSFRRWVDGGDPAADMRAGPPVRNRPDLDRRAAEPDAAGDGALFLRRVGRGQARHLVGAGATVMGAQLADGVEVTPLPRAPAKTVPPKRADAPLQEDGPLQEMPAEISGDGMPLSGPADGAAPGGGDAYAVTIAVGEGVGAALGENVGVMHVARFARGERPAGGTLVVYPRSRFRPFGPVNSFEHLDPFQEVNVEPLQSAADAADPSPAARSAYAIGNWDLPGDVALSLSDRSMQERREWLLANLNRCCGPTHVSVMHGPLALVLGHAGIRFMPGRIMTVIPLAPGIRAW